MIRINISIFRENLFIFCSIFTTVLFDAEMKHMRKYYSWGGKICVPFSFSFSLSNIQEHSNSAVVVVFWVPSSQCLSMHVFYAAAHTYSSLSSSSSLSSCFYFLDLHLVSLPVSILSNFISLNTFFSLTLHYNGVYMHIIMFVWVCF